MAQVSSGQHLCQHSDSIAVLFSTSTGNKLFHSYRLFNGSKHHCHKCDRRWLDVDNSL